MWLVFLELPGGGVWFFHSVGCLIFPKGGCLIFPKGGVFDFSKGGRLVFLELPAAGFVFFLIFFF